MVLVCGVFFLNHFYLEKKVKGGEGGQILENCLHKCMPDNDKAIRQGKVEGRRYVGLSIFPLSSFPSHPHRKPFLLAFPFCSFVSSVLILYIPLFLFSPPMFHFPFSHCSPVFFMPFFTVLFLKYILYDSLFFYPSFYLSLSISVPFLHITVLKGQERYMFFFIIKPFQVRRTRIRDLFLYKLGSI
jgi:hypothetical protein